MQLHLDQISRRIARKAHGVQLMNQAGWHTTGQLKVPGIFCQEPGSDVPFALMTDTYCAAMPIMRQPMGSFSLAGNWSAF
jgi:hypothetical protein